jgi:hypothetical protein
VKPQEHVSEATRLAAQAEAKSREPNQPFDPAPWLKAQTHALLAIAGDVRTWAAEREDAANRKRLDARVAAWRVSEADLKGSE